VTPLSILRIFGLGLFGWAFLGLGIYLASLAVHDFRYGRYVRSTVNQPAIASPVDETQPADESPSTERAIAPRPDWEKWAIVFGALACLGGSVGGVWPVRYFLGSKTDAKPPECRPATTLSIDRPDGSKLHVEIYGDASQPTLLLTHGWTLDISAWDYVKNDLVKRYRVVAWDLAGLGKSGAPTNADFSIEKMAHDLESVIQAISVKTPLFLVGHSIGGMIQQTFCRLYPQHLNATVTGLILVHTTYINPVRTSIASGLLTAIEKPIIVPLNYLMIALAPLAWLSNWQSYWNGSLQFTSRFTSFTGKQTYGQIDHGARLMARAWPATVARGNLAMLKFNEEKTLPQIDAPVLIVAGTHDRLTLPSASEHIEQLLPVSRLIRISSGHLGHWELSKRVLEAICEFVEPIARERVQPAPQLSHRAASAINHGELPRVES
jgi:pimeloyl-ACP methyl ester carboxylesterase